MAKKFSSLRTGLRPAHIVAPKKSAPRVVDTDAMFVKKMNGKIVAKKIRVARIAKIPVKISARKKPYELSNEDQFDWSTIAPRSASALRPSYEHDQAMNVTITFLGFFAILLAVLAVTLHSLELVPPSYRASISAPMMAK